MGKNRSLFQLPMRPVEPIRLLNAYDDFFVKHLRDIVREDRERHGDTGLPTYHANMLRIVGDYAGDHVDPEQMSRKDLGNFLAGMRSQTPRLRVLDAYIQIVNPSARARCFADEHILNVGNVLADYLKSPVLEGYERELQLTRLLGVYRFRDGQQWARRGIPRFVVARRNNATNFVVLYIFNGPSPGMSHPDQLRLRTGICVPQPTSFLFVMKDYLHKSRYVGSVHFTVDRFSKHPFPFLNVTSLVARERNFDANASEGDDSFEDFLGSDRDRGGFADRVSEAETIGYITKVVDSFEGVL